ncbi:MAG: 50S ribosomal protein L29 [Acidimicrobiales bacterium]
MVTAAEISGYDIEELETQLSETRRELFNLRFQLATGRLDNFSRLSHVRKDIARMMTEIRAREIAESEGLTSDEIPAHRAAARLRSEDEALGRIRTTAAERRRAAASDAEAGRSTESETAEGEAVESATSEPGVEDPSTGDGDDAAVAAAGSTSDASGDRARDEDEG